MRNSFQYLIRFASIAFCLFLVACSGGGGGGGDGGRNDGLSLSTNVLTFNAPNTNSTPPSQIITATVTGVNSGTLYIKIVSTGPAVASITNIIITGSTTGQGTINPASASTLGAGTHTSTITVYACTTDPDCTSGQLAGSPQTVNVTYTITGVAASTASLNYSIGDSPVAADFTRQFNVTGYPNQNWNAASNVSWLSVLPANGNTGTATQVTASLVQAQLDVMSGGTYTGTVTLTPSSGLVVTIPVTLTIARVQVNYVSPYVAFSGVSNEVIIRGDNFNNISVQNVTFGGINAIAFNVISNTEVRATHPALSAGNYPVQLQNNLGINRSLANLVVVDAPGFSEITLSYLPIPPNGSASNVIGLRYDAERQALIVVQANQSSSANNKFLRYVYSNGAWGSPTSIPVFNLHDIALSTDGKFLLAASSGSIDSGITQIDATTLSIGTTTNDTINGTYNYLVKSLAVANDGTAVVASAYAAFCGNMIRYRIRIPEITAMGVNTCSPAKVGGSADGSMIIAGTSIAGENYAFNASTGISSPTGIPLGLTASPVLNRSGSRIVINNNRVYDASFTLLGNLPGTTQAVTLKPDGSRAYTYDSSGMVRTFDLTGVLVGGIYPEVGTGTTPPDNPGTGVHMTISPDGGTLFFAGSNLVIVLPVP